jgi:hypothetical protein
MKAPWKLDEFDGENVTSYLRKYNLLTADALLTGSEKVGRFATYSVVSLLPTIESLPGYVDQDWKVFEKSLKKEYFERDREQLIYQIPYLQNYCRNRSTHKIPELREFAQEFRRLATVLIDNGKLSQYSACADFMSGLTEKEQDELQQSVDIDWEDTAQLKIETLMKDVIGREDRRRERNRLLTSTLPIGEIPGASVLVNSDPKTAPISVSGNTTQPTQIIPPTRINSNNPASTRSSDIDFLTKQMSEMSIAVTELMKFQQQAAPHQSQTARSYGRAQVQTVDYGRPGERRDSCWYCGENGHIKPRCRLLGQDIANGMVHLLEGDNRLYLGATGNRLLERGGQQTLRDALMATTQAAPTNVNSIEVEDEMDEYWTAAVERRDPLKPHSQGVTKTTPGARRVGQDTKTTSAGLPSNIALQLKHPNTDGNRVVPQARVPTVNRDPKDIEMKDTTRPVRTQKDASPTFISALERIARSPAPQLQWGELIALMPPHTRRMIIEDRHKSLGPVVNYVGEDEFCSVDATEDKEIYDAELVLNTLSLNNTLPRGFLKAPTPYICVQFGQGHNQYPALVDTGSMVNLISQRMVDQLQLPIRTGKEIGLSGAGGMSVDVNGMCEDILVTAVGQHSLQTFVVTPSNANDVILGLPWFVGVGGKITAMGRGKGAEVSITVNGPEGTESTVVAISSKDLVRTADGLKLAKN